MYSTKIYRFLLLGVFSTLVFWVQAQTAWFADGYHGGVYGHYPKWQSRFMIDELKEHPDWAINLEIEPETWDTVSVNDAKNFKAFQKYYTEKGQFGRIEFVNPAYAQPYSYNISGESIIRHFAYGMHKTREYFPEATFLTYSAEEPCFTSSLPQILKGFGYKYAVIRNPNTCWGGYTSAFGKDLVNWIGPDGTFLPAVPRYECEQLSAESTWQTDSWTNSNEFIAACFADGIKYPVGMTFQDAGWDGGPWANEYQPTEYTCWTPYIEMISEKVTPVDWRFTLEDVKPGLVWGAQVLQKLAQEVRVSENRLVMAEKMASLNYILNGEKYPINDFAEAWRTLMLAQHHDCWIVPYNGKPGETWADNVTRWTNTSNRIAKETIAKLYATGKAEQTKAIRVFNTLGVKRNDLVRINLPEGFEETELAVFDINGSQVPCQVLTDKAENKELVFEAEIPALGYATFTIKTAKSQVGKPSVKQLSDGKTRIEMPFYIAEFDPAEGGAITSLIDKKNHNHQLVETGKSLNGLRGYFYKEEKFHESSDSKAAISVVKDGPLLTKIKVENKIAANNYTQLITFNKTSSRIDFELIIDWNGQPGIGAYDQSENYEATDRDKAFYNDSYKLHLQFPLAGLNGKLYKNGPFDVCESALENTVYNSWDSIKHNVILNWVDLENESGDYGVSLFSDHTTSYLQTEDLALGLTVQYVGKGLWGRDYRIDGPTHLKYALMPHTGNWEEALVEKHNNGWNEPLIGSFVQTDEQESQFSLLETSDENLHVSSITVDGDDLLVRFYNTSKNQNHEIQWNCDAKKFELVDLNGTTISPIKTIKNNNGKLSTRLDLPQFGFQTVRLTHVNLK